MQTFSLEENSHAYVIKQRSDFAARLFGLPFLVVGIYFLYQAIGAVYDTAVSGNGHVFLENLPGFLLLLFMMLGFAVPGVLLVFFRKKVVIDLVERTVLEMTDFLLYKKQKHHRLDAFSKVSAREQKNVTASKKNHTVKTTYMYVVALCTATDAEVIVVVSSSEEEANTFAQKLARFIGKPFEGSIEQAAHHRLNEQHDARPLENARGTVRHRMKLGLKKCAEVLANFV